MTEENNGWGILTKTPKRYDPLSFRKSWLMYHGEPVAVLEHDGHLSVDTRHAASASASMGSLRDVFRPIKGEEGYDHLNHTSVDGLPIKNVREASRSEPHEEEELMIRVQLDEGI